MLVKSRWRFVHKSNRVPLLLAALGIEYRKAKGSDFWKANRLILPELYRELQAKVRRRMRDFAAIDNGDPESFRLLIEAWRHAQRSFAYYLPPVITPSMAVTIPLGKGLFDRREKNRERKRLERKIYYARHKNDPEFIRKDRERVARWKKLHRTEVNLAKRIYWASPKGQAVVARRRLKRQRDST